MILQYFPVQCLRDFDKNELSMIIINRYHNIMTTNLLMTNIDRIDEFATTAGRNIRWRDFNTSFITSVSFGGVISILVS